MTWYDDTPDTPEFVDGGSGSDAERWPADGLDRLIAETAREYNAPPTSVPRDAMWSAIVAARGAQATPTPAPVSTEVTSLAEARAKRDARIARNRGLWAVAAAAAIFLATGVGIGRWWGRGEVAANGHDGQPRVAATSPAATTPAAQPDTTAPDAPNAPNATQLPNAPDTPRSTHLASLDGAEARRTARAGAGVVGRAPRADLYDVAVMRHFAQVEALLVSYRTDTVDVAMDTRLAGWARPLLGDTRLLLDSPAARDPRRRRLLEDLELVLAEMARLAPADSAAARDTHTERQLIDGTLRRAQLLPRLRTLVPAGT